MFPKLNSVNMNLPIIPIKTVPTPDIGSLSFFEAERDIPFPIKRFYYIHGAPKNTQRGAHAHKALRQFLFCPYGSIKLLMDDGRNKETFILDNPAVGIIVDPLMWHDMVWLEENSVLCVAASDYYNEADYLRDYDEFIKYLNESVHSTAQMR